MDQTIYVIAPLLIGWLMDRLIGDPPYLPHLIVLFGKIIAKGEIWLNRNSHRLLKGAVFSVGLILLTFCIFYFIDCLLSDVYVGYTIIFNAVMVFFCLAGKSLIDEVKGVFIATDKSLDDGRKQVARIVGRDASGLSAQEVHTAALETLSENLSDGVVAPLFWYFLLGVPGMVAYKMVNTLDSMIGYRNERYKDFGCWAARIDDVANYIPARLTAFLMLVVSGHFNLFGYVLKYGSRHSSLNSGYPEAALAGILNCRFGGPHVYFGQLVEKPYIGTNDRELKYEDMQLAVKINLRVEMVMVILISGLAFFGIVPLLRFLVQTILIH